MEGYLYEKDLYLPLEGVENKPINMKNLHWVDLEGKELGTIWLCLTLSMALNIA